MSNSDALEVIATMLEASITGYVVAVFVGVVAVYFWKKSTTLDTLWKETAKNLELAKHKEAQKTKETDKQAEKHSSLKQALQKAEKELDNYKTKLSAINQQIEAIREDSSSQVHHASLKLEHMRSQIEVLTSQLKESEGEKINLKSQLKDAHTQTMAKEQTTSQILERQIAELKIKYRDLELQKTPAKKDLTEDNKKHTEELSKEMLDMKRRLVKSVHLYKSMKGLREMAEERSVNYEVALRKLALWVVQNKNRTTTSDERRVDESSSIGVLMGSALEAIGAKLIDDEFASTKVEATSDKQDLPLST